MKCKKQLILLIFKIIQNLKIENNLGKSTRIIIIVK